MRTPFFNHERACVWILWGIFPSLILKQITLFKVSKNPNHAQLGQSMCSLKHVTDAGKTSKMPLQMPVEIFKEPDATVSCLPQPRMCPVTTFQRGGVVQPGEEQTATYSFCCCCCRHTLYGWAVRGWDQWL